MAELEAKALLGQVLAVKDLIDAEEVRNRACGGYALGSV